MNVRYGVAGASGIARRRFMPAFRKTKNSVLHAVCSRERGRAESIASEFNAPQAFDDLHEMLDCVDAVYVATPPHCHLADATKVLAAGKHLLIEKPLARTSDEARRILALARERRCIAMEGYMMKFHPAHREIGEAVRLGMLGDIVYARARLGCWYPDIEGAWRQEAAHGGGALLDLGSHLIDLLTWIVGPLKSIRAQCSTQLFNYAVEDSATVILEFQSGAHGIVEAFFSMPDQAGTGVIELIGSQGRVMATETIGQNGGGSVDWQIFGEQHDYDPRQATAEAVGKRRTGICEPTDIYAAQIDYFSERVLSGQEPEINGLEDGVRVLEWIEDAYQNAAL